MLGLGDGLGEVERPAGPVEQMSDVVEDAHSSSGMTATRKPGAAWAWANAASPSGEGGRGAARGQGRHAAAADGVSDDERLLVKASRILWNSLGASVRGWHNPQR